MGGTEEGGEIRRDYHRDRSKYFIIKFVCEMIATAASHTTNKISDNNSYNII